MRTQILWNDNWDFTKDPAGQDGWAAIALPHTWNAQDGQGGGRYCRGTC